MADTVRENIIQGLVDQMETLTSRGYGNVHRGRTYFEYEDLPCMAILPGVETAERFYGEQQLTMPVVIHAIQVIGDKNVSELAETMLGSLIDAVIGNSSNISSINDIYYVEGGIEDYPGEEDQALSVRISIEVSYNTNIGDPYNQTSL